MKTLHALALAPALMLQGCSDLTVPLPGNLRPPELSTCGAVDLQDMVGQKIARIPADTRAQARIIRPGEPVTMDYHTARLNFDLDASDRIKRIWCG